MRDYRAAASVMPAALRIVAVVGWACLVTQAGPAHAQETPAQQAQASGRSSLMVSLRPVADAAGETIRMPVGRGTLIDVNEPLVRASVANTEIAEVQVLSPNQLLLTGKAPGVTELVMWGNNNAQSACSVVVEMDVTEIREAIARVAPGVPIEVIAVRDSLVLSGTVPDVDTVSRIMEIARLLTPKITNQLKVAGEQQVLLRCTVAEVDKHSTRQLGINGWLAGDNLHDIFVVNQIDQINPANIGATAFGPIGGPNAPRIPFATDKDGISLLPSTTMSLGFPRIQMQLFLQALRENGLIRVLAEPNIVALNGQEAKFIVGGEIPYPLPSATGTPGIEFREYGIQLRFIPSIIGRQMVRLTVSPTVSEPDFALATQGVPGLRSRGATTTIELASGSTIAIAGLLSDNVRGVAKKVPALGDVPVLGALFSSVDYQRSTTELVILVTPELVSSMQPDQVSAVPGQHTTSPNDFELFGLGLLEGKPDPDELPPEAALETMVDPRVRKFSSPPEQLSLHGPWGHADRVETAQ
ncbi:MAG TPA: pilus assembly protein N-terminal domain-containing protein [Phycisphaerae bacterium]|nr:pilus assembly protein N-terminal domain-containing protein [Phycisphaerae bacterium]HON67566.1 pilus assembly protein N-terminal domain-containing protein [Phycisphaerae bacterium]HPP26142.1 pilus assembly protein N-terminal domain-containing protein [Phycisphaerae bacterium]HPU26581.1 pilus assembly protein N-terminal domain-containing protein [Phycisphaerae bacterium]HQE28676.1 pilus assembly protein N-terminal domain-containing protein [Phycisphaerae bacterium]